MTAIIIISVIIAAAAFFAVRSIRDCNRDIERIERCIDMMSDDLEALEARTDNLDYIKCTNHACEDRQPPHAQDEQP